MAAKVTHKWAFKPGMRAGAYSWKSSTKAVERLKSASAEIRAVARTDPTTAAEGVIALAQRIWPAFEHIDTSSGALGNAVRRTLEELLPVLIEAPADEKIRAKWLEQLRESSPSSCRTRRKCASCGPVPQRRNIGKISAGSICTSPAMRTSSHATGGMPVTNLSIPIAAQPAMSETVHPQRAAVS